MKTKEVILRDSLPKDCIWDAPYMGVGEWKLVNTPSEHVRRAMGEYAKQYLLQAVERITDHRQSQLSGVFISKSYLMGLDSAVASIRQLLKELE